MEVENRSLQDDISKMVIFHWTMIVRKMQQLLLFMNRHRHPRGIGHGSRLRGGVQLIKKWDGPNETA